MSNWPAITAHCMVALWSHEAHQQMAMLLSACWNHRYIEAVEDRKLRSLCVCLFSYNLHQHCQGSMTKAERELHVLLACFLMGASLWFTTTKVGHTVLGIKIGQDSIWLGRVLTANTTNHKRCRKEDIAMETIKGKQTK